MWPLSHHYRFGSNSFETTISSSILCGECQTFTCGVIGNPSILKNLDRSFITNSPTWTPFVVYVSMFLFCIFFFFSYRNNSISNLFPRYELVFIVFIFRSSDLATQDKITCNWHRLKLDLANRYVPTIKCLFYYIFSRFVLLIFFIQVLTKNIFEWFEIK